MHPELTSHQNLGPIQSDVASQLGQAPFFVGNGFFHINVRPCLESLDECFQMKRGRVGYYDEIEFLAEREIEILKDSDVFRDNLCGRWKIPGSHHSEFANSQRMQIIEMPDSDG